jgi:hypothetical protein
MRAVRTPHTVPPLELLRMLRGQNLIVGSAYTSADDLLPALSCAKESHRMEKPQAIRRPDIQAKIAYADHRYQEVMNTLFVSKKAGGDPAFLVHACADIISTVRECLDYLGQDIIQSYIVPKTTNQRLLQSHSAGKLKVYFPFYDQQVSRPGSVFRELEGIAPDLYMALLSFTSSIADSAPIPGTLFTYRLLLDVKDMVNEKKHDKLIAVVSQSDQEILIDSPEIKIVLPIKGQTGWTTLMVEPGSRITRVSEYRFAYNDEEVGKFCLFATRATERVVEGFYRDFFA